MWVNSEYAGELAVLSAWIAAILPWTFAYESDFDPAVGGSVLAVRSGLVELQLVWGFDPILVGGEPRPIENVAGIVEAVGITGVPVTDTLWVSNPILTAVWMPDALGSDPQTAAIAGAIGGAFIAVAFAFSLLLYFFEERVESGPVDPVRTMGVLLGGAALAFLVSSYYYWVADFPPGTPVPVGSVLLLVLSVSLLTVDRTDFDTDPVEESGDAPEGEAADAGNGST